MLTQLPNEKKSLTPEESEKLKCIKLLMDPIVKTTSEEKCGERFNVLYDKSLEELKIYCHVFK